MKSPWPLLTFLHCTNTGTETHLNAKPRWQKNNSGQCCFLATFRTQKGTSNRLNQLPFLASHHDQCCLAAASGCNHFMAPKVPTAFCHCNGFSSKKWQWPRLASRRIIRLKMKWNPNWSICSWILKQVNWLQTPSWLCSAQSFSPIFRTPLLVQINKNQQSDSTKLRVPTTRCLLQPQLSACPENTGARSRDVGRQ